MCRMNNRNSPFDPSCVKGAEKRAKILARKIFMVFPVNFKHTCKVIFLLSCQQRYDVIY